MAAIAPPEQMESAVGIAPGDTPVAAPVSQPADLHSLYEDAVQTGNPVSMYSLTSRAKGTPYEGVIRKSAETMNRNLAEFEKDVEPIKKAGGVGTPQGNLAAAKVYETVADNPQKGRALFEWLIGNKNWSQFITGGKPTTTIGYDTNGKQLERTVNELGQIISVRDSTTRQLLTPEEVDKRGGFLPSLENALGFQQQKEVAKVNAAAHSVSNKMAALGESIAPAQKAAAKEGAAIFQQIYDMGLTDAQRKEIGSFSTRQLSKSQNRSAGLSALSQAINSSDNKVSAEYAEALKPGLAALGLRLGADRSIQNSSGQTLNRSQLESLQKSISESTEAQNSFTQDKETFLANAVFNNLGPKERTLLGRALDLQFGIEKANADLADNRLPFLKNPASIKIGDEFNRAEAGMLVHEFNADAMEAYANWRRREMQNYKEKGLLPQPMELEAAFARSDEYKALAAAYAERTKGLFQRPPPTGAVPTGKAENVSERFASQLGMGEQTPAQQPSPAKLEQRLIKPKKQEESLLPTEREAAGALSRAGRPSLDALLKKHGGGR